jgi:hypothetical protein
MEEEMNEFVALPSIENLLRDGKRFCLAFRNHGETNIQELFYQVDEIYLVEAGT